MYCVLRAGLLTGSLVLGILPSFSQAVTDEWPTYLHDVARSSASADTTFSTANIANVAPVWTVQTGGVIAASATIVGGAVYVGSWDGYEYALNASTGAVIWKTYLGITTAPNCSPAQVGISSAAAVQNGTVYVGGGDSYWYALDANTGVVLWRVFTGDNSATGGHYNWSSPLLYNGFAYVGVTSLGDCPLVPGQLLKVDLNAQQVVATTNLVPTGKVGGGIWTSPALDVATGRIFLSTGTETSVGQLYAQAMVAVDMNSMAIVDSWKLPEDMAVTDSDFSTTPILFTDANGNPLVATVNKDGYLYVFNRSNLAAGPVWERQIALGGDCPQCGNASVSSNTWAENKLFVAGGNTTIAGAGYLGSVRALDPTTGNVIWEHPTTGIVIGHLSYANGLIFSPSGSALEALDASTGNRLYSYDFGVGLYAGTVVAEGQAYVGTLAGKEFAFGPTNPIVPPLDPNCPNGWICQDVGSALPPGSEDVSGNTWSASAGGSGLMGTSDQFRLMTESANANTQVIAQIASLQATAGSQGGVILRQDNTPGSPYYALVATPNGLTVLYRKTYNTSPAIFDATAPAMPYYLEIQRSGDTFQAATSTDGVNWTLVPGTTATLALPAQLLAGLAVTSGINLTSTTATFSNVAVSALSNTPHSLSTASCPAPWSCAGIGNPLEVGGQTLLNGVWTILGGGSDIWNSSDQFNYVYQPATGTAAISARVTSQTNTSPNAKAGVMFRTDTTPGSAYYAFYLTPSNGLEIQCRTSSGYTAIQLQAPPGAAPVYLGIGRSATVFTAYTSSDGATWVPVPESALNISALGGTILAGLAVSSHNTGELSTVTMDNVSLANTTTPPNCPTGWTCQDVGSAMPSGNQIVSGNNWNVTAGGSGLADTSDQFHLMTENAQGNTQVIARITSLQATAGFQGGVILRQDDTPGSLYYALVATPGGLAVLYRKSDNASPAIYDAPAPAMPYYLEIQSIGNTLQAATSSDGVNWTLVPGTTATLAFPTQVLAGLAVASGVNFTSTTATFTNVAVSALTNTPLARSTSTCPAPWSCAGVGNPLEVGGQTLSNGVWTINGGGGDIWESSDQFNYVYQSVTGNAAISGRVTGQSNTSPFAKAGVMFRADTTPGSAYYAFYVTPSNGLEIQYRTAAGNTALQLLTQAGTPPVFLGIGRSGTTLTAYTSTNGSTWLPVAKSGLSIPALGGTTLAGLAVTSHNTDQLGTVTMDNVSLANTATPSPTTCPTTWQCNDIGSPTPLGQQAFSNNIWSISGGGSEIGGSTDSFHFVSQSLAADGSVSADISSQSNSNSWAMAGVMLRLNISSGSPYYAAFVTPAQGLVVQYRSSPNVTAAQIVIGKGAAPVWLRVTRRGLQFSAYTSKNGVTWTLASGSTFNLTALSGSLNAGLAVCSHNSFLISQASFVSVAIGNSQQ